MSNSCTLGIHDVITKRVAGKPYFKYSGPGTYGEMFIEVVASPGKKISAAAGNLRGVAKGLADRLNKDINNGDPTIGTVFYTSSQYDSRIGVYARPSSVQVSKINGVVTKEAEEFERLQQAQKNKEAFEKNQREGNYRIVEGEVVPYQGDMDPMFFRDMPVETMSDFFEKYSNLIEDDSQRLARGNEIISKLVNRLRTSVGVDGNVITMADALAMLTAAGKSYSGEPGFFFNGKAYIIAERATTEVVFHEFAHPIIRAIAQSNPELFKSLYDQLASTAEGEAIIERVRITHKELTEGTPEFMEEALALSLGKKADNINNNLQETNVFTKFIKDFLYAIKQLFRKGLFPGQKIKVENLDVNTTLDELAEMITNSKFKINTEIVTQKDVVSFTREFNKDLVKQIANIDQKRTRLIGAALYSMARKQKNLISGVNYKDVAGVTKDLMGRSDIAEIIGNLRDYQNNGIVPGETPEQQEEFLTLHATALLNSILRLEGASERVLASFNAIVNVIENESSTPQEQQKALLSAFYTNRVTKEWIKFIEEAKEQLREANVKPSHEIFRILNDIKETLDRATAKSKKIYTKGVSAMLIEQLTPMKQNIDDHYKTVIQKLRDKGASDEVIKLYENEYDAVRLTDDKIKSYLLGELGDAHSLNVFLEGFAHAQDPVIMGFAGYVKNRFVQMNAVMHDAYYGFINNIEPLVNKAGYNSAYSRMNMGKDMLYLDVVERDNAGVPTKMVWKYITPFKDYKGEYRKLKKDVDAARKKVDQNNTDENNIELVLAIENLEKFEQAYMHRKYTSVFYEKAKFFTDDIGKEAEKRRDRVLSKLRSLKSGIQSPDDVIKNTEDAKLAWREYKQLSDLFYEDGTPKDPESMDYKVAERLQEYKNYTKKFYDWVPLKGVFENAYINYTNSLKAKGLTPEQIEIEQEKWLALNTVQKLSKKFYEERAALFLELQRLAEEDPSQKEVSDIFAEITRLISPYKDDNGEPEALTMPDHVVDRVIELEKKLIEMRDNVPSSVSKAMPADTYAIYLSQLPEYKRYIAGDKETYKDKTQEEIDSVLSFMEWATDTLTSPYIEKLREKFIRDNGRYPDSSEAAQIKLEAVKMNENESKKRTVLRKLMDLQERVPTQDYVDMLNMFFEANPSLKSYLESEGVPAEGVNLSDYKLFFNETILAKVLSINPAITYRDAKGNDVIITFSEWLDKNHFRREYAGKGGKIFVKYTPSRVWSRVAPKDPSYYETTTLYDPITNDEIRTIQGVPSLEYWTKIVKDEFVDDEGKIVKLKTKPLTILDCIRQGIGIENATIDMHGDWLPRMDVEDSKFINPQFFDMRKNSPDKYNLLIALLKQHLTIQETVPYDSRLDLEYERYRSSQYEIISNRSTEENLKQNPISRYFRNLRQFFAKSADDFEMGFNPQDRENYVKADLFDDAYVKVPVTGMYELSPDLVTMDMLTSISRYQQSLIKQKTLIDMLPMAKVLHSLVQTPPNELKESAAASIKKERFMNRVAASLTVPFGSRASNFREIAIRGFIEREFEGKSLDGFFGNTPGVQKFADILLSISSTTFFAFNIPAALKNSMGAQWQALIQAAAGDNFNAKDFAIGNAWSAKVTSEITMEVYKFGNKSMNYQLVELMDPTQGRLSEGIREGKGISKSAAKDMISLKYATSVREWTQLQSNLAIFGAMLNKKLIDYTDPKTGVKGKVKYSEAWEVVDGKLKLKAGVDESYAPGARNYVAFVKRLHGVVNKANGAYDSFNQPLASRYLLYRMIMHLKKYFMELFMERFKYRWSPNHRMIVPRYDGYTDSIGMGYYVEFLRATKRFFTTYKMNFYNLTDTEREAASKVMMEGGLLVLFNSVLLGLLFGWDDDDEDRFAKLRDKSDALPLPFTTDNPDRDFRLNGWLSNHLLNLTLQIEAENDSWIPLPGMGLRDYKDIALMNSAALSATFGRWEELITSLTGMASGEVYKRSAGPYEWQQEGRYKFWNHLGKLLTFTGTTTEPIQAIETLDKRNR
jgi:hypothetical protein